MWAAGPVPPGARCCCAQPQAAIGQTPRLLGGWSSAENQVLERHGRTQKLEQMGIFFGRKIGQQLPE